MTTNSYESHPFEFYGFAFVNSYYSSTQVHFSSQKVSTLSGHSQLICWCWGGSMGSTQATYTGCFLNGLHLAVTSDVPVILPLLLETSLVPWCQADSTLIIVVEICIGFVGGYPGPVQSKLMVHKVSSYTSPVRA